jgi:LysM repeat protein
MDDKTPQAGSGQDGEKIPAPLRNNVIIPPKSPTWIAVRVLITLVFLALVWEAGSLILQKMTPAPTPDRSVQTAAPSLEHTAISMPEFLPLQPFGIYRLAQIHTYRPERPRFDLTTYTVKEGDTISAIAKQFGLKTQTILWSNYDTLSDDADMLLPGMKLNILPLDGAMHTWMKDEGLNKVSSYFHVTPQDILDWPGNHLTLESVGDFAKPNIAVGTKLVIPGGWRDFISKVGDIPRASPGVGSYLGPGFCENIIGGAVGTGAFVWPVHGTITTQFTPEAGHPAIDIATTLGTPVAAADTGVVVYAGMTYDQVGYGNLIIIDHGNGWQTLYAHLSAIYVKCGYGVFQGASIGALGSTGRSSGPHLHFQMQSTKYGKVNPLQYLP